MDYELEGTCGYYALRIKNYFYPKNAVGPKAGLVAKQSHKFDRRNTAKKGVPGPQGLAMSKDIAAMTKKDVAEHKENSSLVLKPAIEEGREVYAA